MTAPTLHRPTVDQQWCMPIHKVLSDAADVIDRHGFAQQGFGSNATGYSLEGAIYRACRVIDCDGVVDVWPGSDDRSRLATAAMDAFIRCLNPWLYGTRESFALVVGMSDREVASRERAVELLRRAAAHARQEASQ